jgi:hypothetical protein
MAQYLTEKQKTIWRFWPNLSEEDNIRVQLTQMACLRKAKLEKGDLELYPAYLKMYDLRAFQVAMARISESERREGETAFPSLGTILAEIEFCADKWTSELHPELDTKPLYFSEPMKLKG